jgi:peptidoglycan/LPS O-acetylase OafA/YrhL
MPDREKAENTRTDRLRALDGLRGVLAVVVLMWHATSPLGVSWFAYPAKFAVGCFFLMSGFVLTRSWDGRLGLFIARRFVRLWPVYALCLAFGYLIAQIQPAWPQFVWYPLITAEALPEIDPPIWSLGVEAYAMPLMPLIVWAGAGGLSRSAISMLAMLFCARFYNDNAFGQYLVGISCFILGSFLSHWNVRNRFLESQAPQWLGRISYSLYLTHWLVFALAMRLVGPWGAVGAIPAAFLIGWLIWRFVERPSIHASRRVGPFIETVSDRLGDRL